MNNNYTWFFILMSLFNTNMGISNVSKNNEQVKKQKEIENKLDKILDMLNDKR